MKYSERTYLAALAALAALRSKMSDAKEQATVDFVADAIAEKADRDTNEPLTLEELKGMDGDPVWLKDGIGDGWFLAGAIVGSKIYFYEKSITVGEPLSECGRSWLAYRTKPEPPEGVQP